MAMGRTYGVSCIVVRLHDARDPVAGVQQRPPPIALCDMLPGERRQL
jgi:hypothetical protein